MNTGEESAIADFLQVSLIKKKFSTDSNFIKHHVLTSLNTFFFSPLICPLSQKILEEHRKNCEQQGKYVEAEIAKNRLEDLKSHEENRKKEAMRARQIAERLGVEEAHMLEFQQFNMTWDKKMGDYEKHAKG